MAPYGGERKGLSCPSVNDLQIGIGLQTEPPIDQLKPCCVTAKSGGEALLSQSGEVVINC